VRARSVTWRRWRSARNVTGRAYAKIGAQSKVVLARAAAPTPPLSGQDAHHLQRLLELGSRALWRMHGDAIADYLACVEPDALSDDSGPDDPPPGVSDPPDSQDEPDFAF
jgi:hypothetical protein